MPVCASSGHWLTAGFRTLLSRTEVRLPARWPRLNPTLPSRWRGPLRRHCSTFNSRRCVTDGGVQGGGDPLGLTPRNEIVAAIPHSAGMTSNEIDLVLVRWGRAVRQFLIPHGREWRLPTSSRGEPLSSGTCGRSSLLLTRVLQNELALDARWACGSPGEDGTSPHGYFDGSGWRGHAWVIVGQRIVDVTADQFGDPPVVVTSASDARYAEGPDLALAEHKASRIVTAERLFSLWLAARGGDR